MAKRKREQDHDGAATATAELNTVFVDTDLGTHLAVLVCSSDTASDFKKKVALEHKHCFPEIDEIQVHSVKVKCRSNYYHLPDSMLIWSAFHGVKRNWFLSVNATNIPICLPIRSSLEPGTSSGVKIGMTDVDDDCRASISDENRNGILPFALTNGAAKEKAVSQMIVKPKADKPVEKTTDSHRGVYSEEHSMGTESPVKKKRKVKHTKDVCYNSGLEDVDAMSYPNGKDVKPNMSDSIAKSRLVSDGTYLPSMAEKGNLGSILDTQNLNGSDRRKEGNGRESVVGNGLGDVHPLGFDSVMVPGSSAGMMDASGGGGDVHAPGKKRKKREAKKTAAKIHDITDMEQIRKDQRVKLSTDKMEEGKGSSLEHAHEVLMPSKSKIPGHVGPDLPLKEASLLQDAEKTNANIGNSHELLDSDERKEDNVLESKIDFEPGQDVPIVHSGNVCTNMSNLSVTLMDAGGGTGSDAKKRKKKKVLKIAKVQDTSDVEHISIGEMKKPHTQTIRLEEKSAIFEHNNEVMLPAASKAPDHVDPDLAQKEASIIHDADAVMEPEISSCIKKRKKKKREKNTNIENSGIKEIQNGIRVSLDLPSQSGDHITEGTGKGESTILHQGTDVEMKLLDASDHDAREKVLDVYRKAADLAESQAEQTLDEPSIRNKMMMENTKSFPGVYREAFPTADTENAIVEPNQVGKDNGNTEDKPRNAARKRKKQKHTTRDVQENLPVNDHQVANEPLATKETSLAFANAELEGIGKKVGENYELVLNTDGLKENTEKGDEGVDFKQYFVGDKPKNQVDLSNKVTKATKVKRSSKKAKDNDLPSINISTELQNSLKPSENKKTDNNSYGEVNVKSLRDSAPKTDKDEMSPNYFKRSSEAAEKEVKDSSLELCKMPCQKPNDTVDPLSFQKKKPSLVKSSSESSKAFHNNRGKEKLMLGQNVTNMMLMKTPKKKILLAKSGAIFQDNSGESSGDENGTIQSNDSTLSPSDSSSMSDDSAGESEVNQSSTSNGSNGAKGKSMAKLEEDLTMDLILRSSKRFKKAKELASQNETQPIEFVPDSQTV